MAAINIAPFFAPVFGSGKKWFQEVAKYADGNPPVMWADFANERYMVNNQSKAFSDIFTFTRSGSGTYRVLGGLATAASNVPRFEKDPVTGEGIGLLREASATNLVTRSEELNDGAWFKSMATVTANAGTAPDGATTADNFVPTAAAGLHQFIRTSADVAVTNTTVYTASCFIKANGYNRARVAIYPVQFAGGSIDVNLTNGNVTATAGTLTGSQVIPLGNGWYRIAVSAAANATGGSSVINVYCLDNSGAASFTGDGTSGILVWGMQVEQGASASSYIPTAGSTLSRAAESCVSDGSKFSAWYNSTAGTQYTDYTIADYSGIKVPSHITNGTINERWGNRMISDQPNGLAVWGGFVQFNDSLLAITAKRIKHICAAAPNNFRQACNGVAGVLDTSGVMPVVDRLSIGANETGGQSVNGNINNYRFYNIRATDSELTRLTT